MKICLHPVVWGMVVIGALMLFPGCRDAKRLLKKGERACAEVMDSGKEVLHRVTDKEGVPDEASAKPDDSIARGRCLDNLKQIGLGMMMYAADHDGAIPAGNGVDGLRELSPYVGDNKVFACPGDMEVVASAGRLTQKRCSYVYVGGLKLFEIRRPSEYPLVLEKSSNHHDCINVLFADGHVGTVASAEIEDKVMNAIQYQFGGDRRRLRQVWSALADQLCPAVNRPSSRSARPASTVYRSYRSARPASKAYRSYDRARPASTVYRRSYHSSRPQYAATAAPAWRYK